jgi:hypothetical protein
MMENTINKPNNIEKCEGCLVGCVYSNAYGFRTIPKEAAAKCPCRICIVKMICSNGCEEYNKFRREDCEWR